jgi:hypothetical protein
MPVDLSLHINQDVTRGHPADFPVGLVRVFRDRDGVFEELPHRRAVVRPDTGAVLSVVSDRYQLVPHQRILDAVQESTAPLDVGPVPRGIYVDRGGARMRAIYKFPALARPLLANDTICPCLTVENSYDAKSRIAVHIGAFRFVCTNLAVGGGGVFAGGFVSLHAGEIRISTVAEQLATFLASFDRIVQTYQRWYETPLTGAFVQVALFALPMRAKAEIQRRIHVAGVHTVLEGYNVATAFATHEMRSAAAAFDLLRGINHGFQQASRLQADARTPSAAHTAPALTA